MADVIAALDAKYDLGIKIAREDGVQDSRLFGSPEFTAQFPNPADWLRVAAEIWRQEQRVLRVGDLVIHSDAMELLGR